MEGVQEKQNEIAVQQERVLSSEKVVDYEQVAKNWLKAMGTNLSDGQLTQFVELAKCYRLNPFKKEIYAVVYNTKDGQKLNIIVGYETYLKRAEATGLLDGWNCDFDGKKATCTIYRKDWSRPFVHSVEMSEYRSDIGLWKTKPATMIKKVAVAQAMRLCFPSDMGGMPYTSEEMSSVDDFEIVEKANLKTASEVAPPPFKKPSDKKEVEGGRLKVEGDEMEVPSADAKSENTSLKKTRRTDLVYPFDNATNCYLGRLLDSVKYKVKTPEWRINFNIEFIQYKMKVDSQEKLDKFAAWAENCIEKQVEREKM